MLNNKELWERAAQKGSVTCEELGLPEWRAHTDGFVYECGGYTIYKTPEGYRHSSGKFVTPFQKWLYGLK